MAQYNNVDKFRYDVNFNPLANFTRIKFGHDMPILETELNEMQKLEEYARTSLMRRLSPSGFIELVQKEYIDSQKKMVLFNPKDLNGQNLFNYIAVAPARAMINGYELNMLGNFSTQEFVENSSGDLVPLQYNDYILLNLGEAPDSGVRDDLVYLEVWFEIMPGDTNIKKWGYQDGEYIGYQMIDPRVQQETSRRIVMCWNLRVAKNVQFDKFPDGLGHENVNNFSPIYGFANGRLGSNVNSNLIFKNAGHLDFKGCEFYKDCNLYVAGRPDYKITEPSIYGNFIYALPLFHVKRRNKQLYSIDNFNGATSYANNDNIDLSYIRGDLNNNIRPDKLCYDFIVEQDLLDLRRTVCTKEFNGDYYLNKGVKELFTGDMQTKDTNQMKRIQFGNTITDYSQNRNVVFFAHFDNTLDPTVVGMDTPKYSIGGYGLSYDACVYGTGIKIDGKGKVKYDITTIDSNKGTVDFYLKPLWDGPTADINQQIIAITDANDNPIYDLKKKGLVLTFTQYCDVQDLENHITVENPVNVDLTSHILLSNNIYHIRLSWTNQNNLSFLGVYINGRLCGQGTYMSVSKIPAKIHVGEVETINTDGAVIEELVVYKTAYEKITNENQYSYIKNEYWTMLANDFIYGSAQMYPSFNSQLSVFTDNYFTQADTINKLTPVIDGNGAKTNKYVLNAPNGTIISSKITPIVYHLNTGYLNGIIHDIVGGMWSGLGTSSATFTSNNIYDEIYVQYDIEIPGGHGGYDIPNEILSAGLIDTSGHIKEVSFNRKGSANPRVVEFYKSIAHTNDCKDYGLDLSFNRDETKAYSRLLYYYVEGNNLNNYTINMNLYGYDVLGVVKANTGALNRTLIKCTRNINEDDATKNSITLEFDGIIPKGSIIELQLACAGLTFEYETQSKTLMENMCKAKFVELIANGMDDTYTIPCFDSNDSRGGILKSALTFTNKIKNTTTNTVSDVTNYYAFYDNEMIYEQVVLDQNNRPTNIRNYLIYSYTVDENSFGTPFITVTFDQKPIAGTKILIPVLVSYQLKQEEVLSIWYNTVPYQGILGNKEKQLKRISDWKYFLTTLSTGNLTITVDEYNINSLGTLVNRLPGGAAYSYTIDGKPIRFNYLESFLTKNDINLQLIFSKDIYYASEQNQFDKYLFDLDTDFSISKAAKNFQDGKIVIDDKQFKVYFPDCDARISKYLGMACLVMDENGEIMILVLGSFDKSPSSSNLLTPKYGDLFKIPTLPTTVQRW